MTTVTQRRYVSHADAHYANGLIDGAYSLRLFGELVTELSITLDHDEGLLAGYESVQFRAPIQCGDVLEVTGTVVEMGTRSRKVQLSCLITARTTATPRPSSSEVLPEPIAATVAVATFVAPESAQ